MTGQMTVNNSFNIYYQVQTGNTYGIFVFQAPTGAPQCYSAVSTVPIVVSTGMPTTALPLVPASAITAYSINIPTNCNQPNMEYDNSSNFYLINNTSGILLVNPSGGVTNTFNAGLFNSFAISRQVPNLQLPNRNPGTYGTTDLMILYSSNYNGQPSWCAVTGFNISGQNGAYSNAATGSHVSFPPLMGSSFAVHQGQNTFYALYSYNSQVNMDSDIVNQNWLISIQNIYNVSGQSTMSGCLDNPIASSYTSNGETFVYGGGLNIFVVTINTQYSSIVASNNIVNFSSISLPAGATVNYLQIDGNQNLFILVNYQYIFQANYQSYTIQNGILYVPSYSTPFLIFNSGLPNSVYNMMYKQPNLYFTLFYGLSGNNYLTATASSASSNGGVVYSITPSSPVATPAPTTAPNPAPAAPAPTPAPAVSNVVGAPGSGIGVSNPTTNPLGGLIIKTKNSHVVF